ncbi:MAG: UDP-2,3-diacylglucosamine diphosphatase LpxI [Pseudomonadota bacterium]
MTVSAPLGVVAGTGNLPVRVVEAARAQGQDVHVIRILGFEEPLLSECPGEVLSLGELGHMLKSLKAAGCKELVFAGKVSRPDFASLKLDWRATRLLPKVMKAARQGDDALLQVLLEFFSKEGFVIRGAEEVAGILTAPSGLIAGPMPSEAAMADIRRGRDVAVNIGRLDIGQGCVVCDGLVLAVEAQEGTDKMLERCAALPADVRGTQDAPRGVLVKVPKPMQNTKIDLPTLGVSTLQRVRAAGLAGVAFEGGRALLIDREDMEAFCIAEGVFLYGLDALP